MGLCLFLLFIQKSFGECKKVEDEFIVKQLEAHPILQQKSLGICYASSVAAAADMILMQNKQIDRPYASALMTAFEYKERSGVEGGRSFQDERVMRLISKD